VLIIGNRDRPQLADLGPAVGDHKEPTRQESRHRQNAPYQRIQTRDGYLMVGAAGEAI
jgi:hypothetical protein